MSEVARVLKRLKDALLFNTARMIPSVTIATRDLEWVLYHFERMDAQDRLHYPRHVEMLADAAQSVLRGATTHDCVGLRELAQALDYSRPGWRNT